MRWASDAGADHRVGRAAALGAVALGVGPELERDRHDLVPGLERQLRRHRAVDATAHGHQRAIGRGLELDRTRRPRRRPERGAAHRRPALPRGAWRGEPAELGGDVVGGDAAPPSSAGRPSASVTAALAAAVAAPQPLGIEARLGHDAVLDPHRDPDQVTAGGAAGRSGMGRVAQAAQAARRVEMVREAAHWKKVAPACRCRLVLNLP